MTEEIVIKPTPCHKCGKLSKSKTGGLCPKCFRQMVKEYKASKEARK
jgi:NMD protein affecting ribosome stability and mRNA decay